MKKMTSLVVGMTVAVVMVGCKPSNNANDLKTLDQFAGGDSKYFCEGKHQHNYDQFLAKYVVNGKSLSAAQTTAMKKALSAVPASLLNQVFEGPARSFIEVTDKITDTCVNATIEDGQQKASGKPFRSCHRVEAGQVKIYIDSNPKEIQAGLVRAFGYYLSEIGLRIDKAALQDNLAVVNKRDSEKTLREKSRVAIAFLEDVDRNAEMNLGLFKGQLPATLLEGKIGSYKRGQRWLSVKGSDAVLRNLFADYVLAEAFDSIHCTDRSRTVMRNDFKLTLQALMREKASKEPCEVCEIFFGSNGFSLAGSRRRSPTVAAPSRASRTTIDQVLRNFNSDQYSSQAAALAAKNVMPSYLDEVNYNGGRYDYVPGTGQWAWSKNGQQSGDGVALTKGANNQLQWQPITPTFNEDTGSYENYAGNNGFFQQNDESGNSFVWNNAEGDTTFSTTGLDGNQIDTQFIATQNASGGFDQSIQYDGYNGEYRKQSDGSNVWYDQNGQKTSYVASKDSDGAWNYTGSIGGQQPSTPSPMGDVFNTTMSQTSMNASMQNQNQINDSSVNTELPSAFMGPPTNTISNNPPPSGMGNMPNTSAPVTHNTEPFTSNPFTDELAGPPP